MSCKVLKLNELREGMARKSFRINTKLGVGNSDLSGMDEEGVFAVPFCDALDSE